MKHFLPSGGFRYSHLAPEARLVALISGYFDDSQASGGDLWVVGGYVGYANQWEYLEQLWNKALADHAVPYFHMREMGDPTGKFAKWHPPADHQDEVIAFFKDLTAAIRKSGLKMFASAVWLRDLERFNADKNLNLEPYPLAAYACLGQVGVIFSQPVTAIFDRVEKVSSKLDTAWNYVNADTQAPGLCDNISSMPLQKTITSRQVPGMQAADFIAWESRKAYEQMRPWQVLPDRPLGDRNEQMRHYTEWTREITGRDPALRKSLDALLTGAPVNAVVWDYQQLDNMHEARRGVWTEAA